MRQIWVKKYGDPNVLQIENAPEPTPRTGEVRVRVEICGVTFADLLARMGMFAQTPKPPFIPGFEIVGVVDQVGQGVPNIKEGDAVFGFTQHGGYSSVVCVPHTQVFKRLKWMPAPDAAAISAHYLMAYMILVVMGSVRTGDKVLIHGASGGIGLAALDICRIIGAETYGTSSPEKHDFLLSHGLQYAIDYRNHDFEKVLNNMTGGRGVQLIMDPFGGAYWPKNYRLLSPAGRLVHYGMASMVSGQKRSVLSTLRTMIMMPFYTPTKLMRDNKAVMGAGIQQLWTNFAITHPWMKQLITWYDEALFRPQISKLFPFEQATAAHQYLHERKNIGKVLLTMDA
jgi:NADPH:quinone reductase-like Zn-dependent oxidoreductase